MHRGGYSQIAPCDTCGKDFEKRSPAARYCSPRCLHIKAWQRKGQVLPQKIFQRDGFTCFYCGKNAQEDGIKLVVDHIYPMSKGGTTEPNNSVTSCDNCNSSKRDKVYSKEVMERLLTVVAKRNAAMTNDEYELLRKQLHSRFVAPRYANSKK